MLCQLNLKIGNPVGCPGEMTSARMVLPMFKSWLAMCTRQVHATDARGENFCARVQFNLPTLLAVLVWQYLKWQASTA